MRRLSSLAPEIKVEVGEVRGGEDGDGGGRSVRVCEAVAVIRRSH